MKKLSLIGNFKYLDTDIYQKVVNIAVDFNWDMEKEKEMLYVVTEDGFLIVKDPNTNHIYSKKEYNKAIIDGYVSVVRVGDKIGLGYVMYSGKK